MEELVRLNWTLCKDDMFLVYMSLSSISGRQGEHNYQVDLNIHTTLSIYGLQ